MKTVLFILLSFSHFSHGSAFRDHREYAPLKEAFEQHREKLIELYNTKKGGMNWRLGKLKMHFFIEEFGLYYGGPWGPRPYRHHEMWLGNVVSTDIGSGGWVTIDEGVIRHKNTTKDGVAAMLCWGVGVRLGGAPPWPDTDHQIASSWAQSAYYAAAKCMKALFENDKNVQIVKKMEVHPLVRAKCETQFASDDNKAAMCMRIAHAGASFARFYVLKKKERATVNLGAFDSQVAEQPLDRDRRFSGQCLANTYFAGALCDNNPREHPRNDDYTTGYCAIGSVGGRPKCWFNPEEYATLRRD